MNDKFSALLHKQITKEDLKKIRYPILILFILLSSKCLPYIVDYYVLQEMNSLIFTLFDMVYVINTYYLFEIVVLILILSLLTILFRSIHFGTIVDSILIFVLSLASRSMYVSRNELLNHADLKLTEAAAMVGDFIHIDFNVFLFVLVLTLLIMIVLSGLIEQLFEPFHQRFHSRKYNLISLAGCIIICGTLYSYVDYRTVQTMSVDDFLTLTDNKKSTTSYVIYRFLQNNTVEVSNETASRDYQDLLALASDASESVTDQKPNVIVIMNESWWNTDNISGHEISFSTDPMEPIHELEKRSDVTTGYVSTSVYGGGTVSSEFDFLTGINSKYLSSSVSAYFTLNDRDVPTIVDYFSQQNYSTTAIHPYEGTFYDRDEIYAQMEFDHIVFEDDMKYKDLYTKYISDDSLVNQIIYEYENTDHPSFTFAVSVANHHWTLSSSFTDDPLDYDYPISVAYGNNDISEENDLAFTNYVNGIYLANLAVQKLIDYFSTVDEPTVIMMFGDHIFSVPWDILPLVGINNFSQKLDIMEKQYTTPVIFWSNYSDKNPVIDGQSMNYLSSLLIDYAQLPQSNMTKILNYESTQFKADTRFYMLDGDGNLLSTLTQDQMSLLMKYRSVEYDLMYGDITLKDLWNPITP